ncbi:MAG TPA: MBL fold metallo-hydrolase [Planctomycetota bacterium]|nr:MBL fold metallo-hydrolase [Planctomycetota bacterium]
MKGKGAKAPRMRVVTIPVGPFVMNCTLLRDEETGKGILLDPGDEVDVVARAVERERIEVVALVGTHGHLDHVGRAAELKERFGAPFLFHRGDRWLLEHLGEQGRMFGLGALQEAAVDRWLEQGDRVEFGSISLEVIHAPGHSPGSICLLGEGRLFAGDVLFQGSVGRVDLWGGDGPTLVRSIKERLFPAGDGIVVHPGHGPPTTIGEERRSNPFVGEGARGLGL